MDWRVETMPGPSRAKSGWSVEPITRSSSLTENPAASALRRSSRSAWASVEACAYLPSRSAARRSLRSAMAWSIAVWVRPGGVVGWMVGSARSFPVGAWPTSARAPAAIRTRAVTSAASRMTTRRSCAAPFGTLIGAAGSTIGATGSANSSRRSRVSVPSPTPFWRYPSAPAGTPGPPALPDVNRTTLASGDARRISSTFQSAMSSSRTTASGSWDRSAENSSSRSFASATTANPSSSRNRLTRARFA